MAHEIKVPSFGESISEGTIAQWLKKDGDYVKKGETIVVIDSEKASSDLEADAAGTLRIIAKAGADVAIGAVIAEIDTAAAAPSAAAAPASPTPAAAPASDAKAAEKAPDASSEKPAVLSPPPALEQILTGPPAPKTPADLPAPPVAEPAPAPIDRTGRSTRVPMTRMRRTIAARLLEAKQSTAMLTTFNEVDMSAIMDMRKRYQDAFSKRHGVKLGFMSPVIKAVVESLKAIPEINASIDGDAIVYHNFYDISVAVSTERGLVVPVVRDCDTKSHADIEKELASLAVRARDNKLGMEELKGGTFTITNGGIFGSLMSTPLLNPPQVGILGMHSIVDRPVAVDGKVEIRPMMYLALSYDHRLIDGKDAVRFLAMVKNYIGEPERLLLGI